jgi:hypothetical protein
MRYAWLMLGVARAACGLVDCTTATVMVFNTVVPSQISRDRQFVVDQLGYVAWISDPLARIADYVWHNPNGSYVVRRPSGEANAPLTAALIALLTVDARSGGAFVPLGIDSPLLDSVPLSESLPYTFRYYVRSPAISADGRVVIDAEGRLLWRPTEACEAGQIYAFYDSSSVPLRFEYSVRGGRVELPPLPVGPRSTRILRESLVGRGGLLLERWASLSASSFFTEPASTPATSPPPPAPAPVTPVPIPPEASTTGSTPTPAAPLSGADGGGTP